jgi:hypothetical protein
MPKESAWFTNELDTSCLLARLVVPRLLKVATPRDLLGTRLQMMDRLAVNRARFGFLEFLDVLGRQLRPVHLNRQLVELGGQGERRLVVLVVHAGQCVRADVEALVPLQDHRQRVLQLLG